MNSALKSLESTAAPRNLDALVSVCAIIPEDAALVESFVRVTLGVLERSFPYHELLLVDNGASPRVHNCVQMLQRLVPNVRLLRLSRRFDNELAIAAALDHCIGDYVVIMDPAKHPPEVIPQMIQRAAEGCDAVVGEPAGHKLSPLERLIAEPVYKVASHIMGFALRPDESYYRVFSRRLVNSIIKIRSKNRSLSCLAGLVGLNKSTIFYPTSSNNAPSGVQLFRQLVVATDIVVSNSAIPLRFAAFLGLIASGANLIYLFYILAVTLLKSRIAEGWLTTSLTHTIMFMLVFFIMAVLCEYTARILDETKEQPLYFVESESNSTVSTNTLERLNVI